MKKYLYIALGASLLMACTAVKEEPTIQTSNPEEVSFGAYLNRSTTKAGAVGELNTTGLQTYGFGVFGYHTDNALYSQAALPNFMYNTKVSTESWTYSPIKYWPNEYGENASSEAIDRLTFFAYAPWVKVNSSTGALDGTEYDNSVAAKSTTTGITRLSRATDTGDPLVSYVVSFDPAKTVDLTWGVAKTAFTNSAGTSEGTNDIAANTPYINVARPSAGTKIDFSFQHALAALNVMVDAKVGGEFGTSLVISSKIYVRSVTFEGFAGEGSLNLNSTVAAGPQWVNYYGTGALSTESVTIYDGLRDGREATSADANEKPANLNANIIQSTTYTAGAKDGVTTTAVNLFNSSDATAPIYVIPTGDNLKVTIAYDVETIDEKILGTYLADGVKHGSVVENTITKTITGIGAMEAGKKYVVALHLGLNSVDFDAAITGWENADPNGSDLPANSGVAVSFTQDGNPVSSPLYLWGSGTTAQRTATVPEGYDAGTFTYSSSNTSVATVDSDGKVTAVAPGVAVITASTVATKATEYSAVGSYTVYVKTLTAATEAFTGVSSDKSIVYVGQESDKVQLTANKTDLTSPEYIWEVQSGSDHLSLSAETGATVTLNPGASAGTATIRCIALGETTAYYQDIPVAVAPDAYTVGGKFSVSSAEQVYFSRGNLQATYDGSDWSGGFAADQWNYVGNNPGNTSINGNGTISGTGTVDLFGWVGASNTEWEGVADYGISNSTTRTDYGTVPYESLKKEWATVPGIGGTDWRTMTSDEWKYVVFDRIGNNCGASVDTSATKSGALAVLSFTTATINTDEVEGGIVGFILFPDDVIIQRDDVTSWGTPKGDMTNVFSMTTCSTAQWKALEAKGCVFLPAAGYRDGNTINYAGNVGCYWSSTASNNYSYVNAHSAYFLYFSYGHFPDRVYMFVGTRDAMNGSSVRLVR